MPVVKLTVEFIENNLACPPDKRKIEYVDIGGTGFYIAVQKTSEGAGTYYLRYKNVDGKTCHQKIGRSSDISLADARTKAKQLKSEIQLGGDPRAEDKAKKQIPTYRDFMLNQYMPYVKPRKRSWKKDESLLRCHILAVFGSKRLNQISKVQVQLFHTMLREEKELSAAQCDHNLKLMRASLNLAVDWDIIDKNPIARIKLFKEDNKVEHYLNDDELQGLILVLKTDRNRMVCNVAKFLLVTGCRLNEALSATWANIDEDNRVWVIPALHSKSKKIRSVPLNDVAIGVLGELGTEDDYEHLFINPRTDERYFSIHKTWNRLRNEAGLPHLRLHDLRHQYASFLVNSGRTLYEVQQILGHSDPMVTQRYAHLSSKSLQAAAASASNAINRVMQVVS
ncbi:MAG: integrase [Methylophaga sp.]|nr:MAG: integrase [Methylophaga sp.]